VVLISDRATTLHITNLNILFSLKFWPLSKNLLQPDEVFLLPCQILLFRLCARKGAYWQVSVKISVSVAPRRARIQNAASGTGKQIVLTQAGDDVSIGSLGS